MTHLCGNGPQNCVQHGTLHQQVMDKMFKHNELEFTKTLPTTQESCVTFHDGTWTFLASCEWDTPSGKHILWHKETNPSIAQMSQDLFHSPCR